MEKIGLVLEGGGSKGAYQVGVLKALLENGYRFDAVTGTSIGALNGAILAQEGLDTLEEFWREVKISSIFDVSEEIAEKLENGVSRNVMVYILLQVRNLKKFIDVNGEKMESYIKKRLDPVKLKNADMKVGCVTFCVSKMQPVEKFVEDMEEEYITDYFVASATYPLYGFYKFNGERYFDGGIWDNCPVNLMASKGYKNIIAIRTNDKPRKRKILYDDLNVTYITPSEDLGSMIDFFQHKIEKMKILGYYDGLRFVKKLQGVKYYIEPFEKSDFMTRFYDLPLVKMAREKVFAVVGKKYMGLRSLLEELGVGEDVSDDKAILSILELYAMCLKIDRFQFLSIDDFLRQIKAKASFEPKEFAKQTKDIKNSKLKKLIYYLAKYVKV